MFIRPIPRRGLFFPPGAIPRVNERHPAAGQLVAAYLGGGRPLGIKPGYGPLSVKTGTPASAVGRTGWHTTYTITSGHVATTGPSGDISVVAVAMRGITPGSAGTVSNIPVIATTVNIVATRAGFILSLGNSYTGTPLRLNAEQYVGGVQSFPPAVWVNGGKETVTGGLGTSDLANGVWYGVGTTFASLAAGNGALNIGTMVDNFFALTGGVQFLAIFQGILPDGMMSELTLNPSGLLVWPEDLAPTIARAPISYPFTPDPVGYEYSPADVALTYTPGSGVQIDTHDGIKKRSRRERRIEALRQRGEAERLADAQALRLALEAALGVAAEVAPAVAPRVVEAVQRAPKPAEVDWRRVAEDAEQYARLSRMVSRLSALVQDEARRLADEDDDDAAFLLGIA